MHKLPGFSQLKKLYNTRVKILVILCSNAFILAELDCNLLNCIIGIIDTVNSIRISLNHNILNEINMHIKLAMPLKYLTKY